jgi:hypothetical protein
VPLLGSRPEGLAGVAGHGAVSSHKGAHFVFFFPGTEWGFEYEPGLGVPRASGWAAHWSVELETLGVWLAACKGEMDAPDLWEALHGESETRWSTRRTMREATSRLQQTN